MTTIAELRRAARAEATNHRIDPRDVDLLLARCVDRSQAWLLAHGEDQLEAGAAAQFAEHLDRRLAGEPIQYILGVTEFYGREFLVDRRVLIPRPETELLVEAVLQRAPQKGRIIDVGTGTGCIAITLTLERSDLSVLATDISFDALALARANAGRLGAPIRLIRTDLLSGLRGRVELIVSNPPYVPASDLAALQTEVRDHEPRLALESGTDGLDAIRRLLLTGRQLLTADGLLAMEIGFGQAAAITEFATSSGWSEVGILRDLAGIERITLFRRQA